ncbi:MAG: histidine kinase, partial [Ferruginibacter sp.]|nr:histidine kinase [Chitinophagaceae bacterium]
MNTNSVQVIFCNSKGTIWISTPRGIKYKRENESDFRKLDPGSVDLNRVLFFGETTEGNLLIACSNNCYELKNGKITRLEIFEKIFQQFRSPLCFEHISGNEWLLGFTSKSLLVDIRQQKITGELPVRSTWCASKVNDSTIITGSFVHENISLVNTRTGIVTLIRDWPASDRNPIGGFAGSIEPIGNNRFAISSRYHGVYIVDLDKQNALVLQHDPADPFSLKINPCRRLFISRTGTMFVQSRGISYTQINKLQIKSQKYLVNEQGERYDAGFTSMVQDRKNNFWVSTNRHLARWDREKNIATFYPYFDGNSNAQRFRTIRAVVTDRSDRIWVGTFGGGMGLLLPDGKYEQYTRDTLHPEHSLPSLEIIAIVKDKDENFIVCTNRGFVLFDPIAKKVQSFVDHPTLKAIAKNTTYYAATDKSGNWWLAQGAGLYYYNRQSGNLKQIDLPGNPANKGIQAVAIDSSGMVYAGGKDGVNVISPTNFTAQKLISKKDGLASNNITGLLCDQSGMLWILGYIGAARYNPATGAVESFDARDGMEQSNHLFGNYYLARDGEVFLTSSEGFNHFYPDKIHPEKKPLQVFITSVELKDSILSMPGIVNHSFKYSQNNFTFSFLAVDFRLGAFIQYRYSLKGFDTGFVYAGKQRNARYTNLPAGKYSFFVEASTNGKDWYASANPVHFNIRKAFWKTWWFIALAWIFLGAVLFSIFYFRIKKVRREEELKRDFEAKLAQVQMNLLRTQMSPHFLFNSLNSINSFILKNDRLNASGYLTKFSRLMRLILDNSRNEWVTLESELKAIELYIQLEALRFNHAFEYAIQIAPGLDSEDMLLPPMLIQPYIENAIWHGLMYNKKP